MSYKDYKVYPLPQRGSEIERNQQLQILTKILKEKKKPNEGHTYTTENETEIKKYVR